MALTKKSGGQAELKTAQGETLAVIQKSGKLYVADSKGNTARITTANVRQSERHDPRDRQGRHALIVTGLNAESGPSSGAALYRSGMSLPV
jgi:hypothetical protein